jgi:hypothetical protein
MKFKEDEFAINSEISSAFNDSMLEGSEVFDSPKFEGSDNLLRNFEDQ